MDEYHMAGSVLMAVETGTEDRVWFGRWREDGLGPQRGNGGGCATMREI